jgi:hypothetical protein
MRDLITLDAYRVDLPVEVLKRMGLISSVDPKFNSARHRTQGRGAGHRHRGRRLLGSRVDLAARSFTCRPRITSTIIHAAPLASATEDAQHPFAAEAHGLTDTLDRVVAADERDFRGDIAPGGSL